MEITALTLGLGIVAGAIALGVGVLAGKKSHRQAVEEAQQLLADARQDAENNRKEILVAAREHSVAATEEAEKRERELEALEQRHDQRRAKLDRESSELGVVKKRTEKLLAEAEAKHAEAEAALALAKTEQASIRGTLERVAGMSGEEARAELIAGIEAEARAEGTVLARRIEEDAREGAERAALDLIIEATQRVNLREATESTVSFIELPTDEMKGRIIGKEGRNIRAIEMATGIDLVVDDTPRTILISSFDPIRREVARVAIDRLVEDGRIHPARIEEVVQKAYEEIDTRIETRGNEVAFEAGIADLHSRLARLLGRMHYHTCHGQNLLQHSLETAWIAAYMAEEVGGRADIALRAGLLHEIALPDAGSRGPKALASAELCARHGESDAVVHAVRSLHGEVSPRSLEALLLITANKLSESRPGARKENLAVFIERLRRLEEIATSFAGVDRAYAIKSGKEIRIIADSDQVRDEKVHALSRTIAKAVEKELNYPGQIKVCVVRETRAVRYAV